MVIYLVAQRLCVSVSVCWVMSKAGYDKLLTEALSGCGFNPPPAPSSLLTLAKFTLKTQMLDELHPVEGPELGRVTAPQTLSAGPHPPGCGGHAVPALGIYIKGEKNERRKRRGENESNGKKDGERCSGKTRQRESIRGRCPQEPWMGALGGRGGGEGQGQLMDNPLPL